MIKFLEWVVNKVVTMKGIVLSGADNTTPLSISDTVWVDLLGYSLGRRLDSSIGHIDYNYDYGTLDFDKTATITNNEHALTTLFQLQHDVDREAVLTVGYPHAHYSDDDLVNRPIWKVEYMILGRADYAGVPWTELPASGHSIVITNTVAGREQIVNFGEIPLYGVPISAQIKIRVWRNGALDSAPTKIKVSFFDMHVPVKYLGSKTPFAQ